jgi:beta-galactosidase
MEGRLIDVRALTNCDSVELFLNGRSLGHQRVKRNGHAAWQVIYEPGRLEAVGRSGKRVLTSSIETTGPARRLELEIDRPKLVGDGCDVACVSVRAMDERGRFVPDACDLVRFSLSAPGRLLGVGNGDPSSHESDKAPFRRLFNGLAMALVQADDAGDVTFEASAEGLDAARAILRATRSARPKSFFA